MLYCIVYDKRAVTAVHDARRGNSLPLAAILCTGVYKQPCQRVRASGSAHCLCAPTCAKDRSREERRPGTVLYYCTCYASELRPIPPRPSSGRSGRLPIAMCMMDTNGFNERSLICPIRSSVASYHTDITKRSDCAVNRVAFFKFYILFYFRILSRSP